MIGAAAFLAGSMVLLHRADGGEVAVAPSQVTALHARAPADRTNRAVTQEARCIVRLADGKLLSVLEPCEEVRRLLEAAAK